jgi:hypothetical protein
MGKDNELVENRGKLVVEMENVTLVDDQGGEITFTGHLYDQTSFYDEQSGVLTKQRLYTTDEGQQAFSIVSSDGNAKRRSAYLVRREDDQCRIFNGCSEIVLPFDWLMLFTQILWDIDIDRQRAESGISDADPVQEDLAQSAGE